MSYKTIESGFFCNGLGATPGTTVYARGTAEHVPAISAVPRLESKQLLIKQAFKCALCF